MPTKRKSDVASTSNAKKARIDTHTPAKALVVAILSDTYHIGNEEVEKAALLQLAQYARSLEEQVTNSIAAGPVAPKPAKTPEQLEEAADKVARAAKSGIRKQMSVCGH